MLGICGTYLVDYRPSYQIRDNCTALILEFSTRIYQDIVDLGSSWYSGEAHGRAPVMRRLRPTSCHIVLRKITDCILGSWAERTQCPAGCAVSEVAACNLRLRKLHGWPGAFVNCGSSTGRMRV